MTGEIRTDSTRGGLLSAEANAFVNEQFANAVDNYFASQSDWGSSQGGGQ